ncbi:MAG: metallophosphoesterase [Candidatus Aenigmatarchaeota archaeon]
MNKNGIKFLRNRPAVFLKEEKALVIAELHLGVEYEFFKKGVIIPSQREKFQEEVEKIKKLTKADKLVIVGDLKHKVPGITLREEKEIPKFLDWLKENFEVFVTKGNHDAEIEKIVPRGIRVYGSRGFKLGNYGFFHGHAWPSRRALSCDYIFTAHLHPGIIFKDKLGSISYEQVWIVGEMREEIKEKYGLKKGSNIVVIPTFNKLLGNIDLLKILEEEASGVLNKLIELENSKVYLLDGTFLGEVKDLRV